LLGDSRVNEQPLLSVMHTIWLREHNRIAENLFRIVPGQTDEFYFQHARRIVIAEMQHIIYNEYLPVIIGKII
jgi:peroxidase